MKRTLFGLVVAAVAMSASADDMMKSGFKDLDANGDGKLSAAEVRSQSTLSADFKTADGDGDGYVSAAEFTSWSAANPSTPSDKAPKPSTDQ